MDNKRTGYGRDRYGAGRANTNQSSNGRRATAADVRAQNRYARDSYGGDRPSAGQGEPSARRLSRDEYAKTHKHKKHGKLFYAASRRLPSRS